MLLVVIIAFPLGPVLSTILIIIALPLDVLAFSVRFYSYLFIPFVKQKKGVVTLDSHEPYILSPSGNALVTRIEETVYASVFIKIPIYKSASEMTDEEKISFSKLFGRIATLSATPIKITSQMYTINKDEYINKIKEKLDKAEVRYNQVKEDKNATKEAIERVNGEVTMWHNMFDSIVKTESHALITFAMVTAEGGSNEEAINIATQNAEEIMAGIGATLGITPVIAEQSDILLFVDPDKSIPFSTVIEQITEENKSSVV
jgi:hypothetical protein